MTSVRTLGSRFLLAALPVSNVRFTPRDSPCFVGRFFGSVSDYDPRRINLNFVAPMTLYAKKKCRQMCCVGDSYVFKTSHAVKNACHSSSVISNLVYAKSFIRQFPRPQSTLGFMALCTLWSSFYRRSCEGPLSSSTTWYKIFAVHRQIERSVLW